MLRNDQIGFIGLGAMGSGMAENLVKSNFPLHVFSQRARTAVDALVAMGACKWHSYTEVAAASDVIILCLPDSETVEAVVQQMLPILEQKHVVIDTGTSSSTSTAYIDELLTAKGGAFAEAPLTGGFAQAKAGTLGALVGAEQSVFEKIEPILRIFCKEVEHLGPVGTGGRAKLISNHLVLGMANLVYEAFHAADVVGVDWRKLYNIMLCGSGNSGVLQRMIGSAIDHNYQGYVFEVKHAHKDLKYISALNDELGERAQFNDNALKFYERAERLGFGGLMISELLRDDVRETLSIVE